jgi:hypothetical protein
MKTRPVTVRLLESLHKEIVFSAEADGTSFADVIRCALSLYLTKRRSGNPDGVLNALLQHLSSEICSQSLKIDVINSTVCQIKQRLDDFEIST